MTLLNNCSSPYLYKRGNNDENESLLSPPLSDPTKEVLSPSQLPTSSPHSAALTMNKHLLYKLILERLTAITQYGQLISRDPLSDADVDQLLAILEQAEDDPLLGVLIELIDQQKHNDEPPLSQTEKDYYDEQGDKFRQKLQHLSLID